MGLYIYIHFVAYIYRTCTSLPNRYHDMPPRRSEDRHVRSIMGISFTVGLADGRDGTGADGGPEVT